MSATEDRAGDLGLPPLLTINQMGKLLQCTTRTVARMRRNGHVPPPVKIGGALRWRLQDVQRWIEEGCPRCEPAANAKSQTGGA